MGIFNFKDGTTTSGNGGKFLIDENLLASIKFIKEGEFNERRGAPAIRIIGEAAGVSHIVTTQGKPTVIHAKGIRLQDIILDFLSQRKTQDPAEYIMQICCEPTAALPIYYYQKLAKMSREDIIKKIDSITSRAQGKKKLKERIIEHRTYHKPIVFCNTPASEEKKKFIVSLQREENIPVVKIDDVKRICECIMSFSKGEICQHDQYLRNLLKDLFIQHYESSSCGLCSMLRQAICRVDYALFYEEESLSTVSQHKSPC